MAVARPGQSERNDLETDDGGLEGYLGRRKTLVKQKQLDNLTFKSSDNDKRSDKDSFNSSLGGWGGQ